MAKDSLGLNNPFPLEVRNVFLYNYTCWMCGENHGGNLELHHIWGRISSSILNAAPLGRSCHDKVNNSVKERRFLFGKTLNFLWANKYKLKLIDLDFLEMVKTDLAGFTVW